MLHRLLILIAALLLPAGAWAQDVEGAWDFRLDNTTIFRFVIEQGEDGEWRGEWSRPDSFNSNGDAFARLRGPVETLDSMAGYEFLGSVELSFDDPRPGAVPDIFRFRVVDEDSLEMIYVGTGLDPYELVRAGPGDVIGDWDASKIYRRSEQGDFTVTEVVDPAAPRPRTRIFELDFSLAPPGGEEEPAAEEGEAAADTVSVEESEETDPADALPELAVEDGLIDDNVTASDDEPAAEIVEENQQEEPAVAEEAAAEDAGQAASGDVDEPATDEALEPAEEAMEEEVDALPDEADEAAAEEAGEEDVEIEAQEPAAEDAASEPAELEDEDLVPAAPATIESQTAAAMRDLSEIFARENIAGDADSDAESGSGVEEPEPATAAEASAQPAPDADGDEQAEEPEEEEDSSLIGPDFLEGL